MNPGRINDLLRRKTNGLTSSEESFTGVAGTRQRLIGVGLDMVVPTSSVGTIAGRRF